MKTFSFRKELGRQKNLIKKRQGSDVFNVIFIEKMANVIYGIENMPVTLIVKPYTAFAKTTIKLCAIFSFLIFVSFTPLITVFLFAVYIALFYITNIFMNFCVKFGYKKFLLIIIFAALYFLCYLGTTNLRHFLAMLYFN
jgi:hypothetical protein